MAPSLHGRPSGFTLLEILIALGVLAFGLSVALGLFAMGATTHKRATDRVNAALLAQSVLADLDASVALDFDDTKLPEKKADPGNTQGPGGTQASGAKIRVVRDEETHPSFDGYRYSVYLTPLDADEDPPMAFFVEVNVHWKEKGRAREEVFHTVILRRVALMDFR